MRYWFIAVSAALLLGTARAPAAPRGTAGPPIKLSCAGPEAVAARKLAIRDKLKVGSDPGACFGHASMYGGSNRQIIAAAPSPDCGKLKAIDVYEQSRAGSWYSFFETPVCGMSVSIGPKDPWGALMITIDGKHYDQRGQYYTLQKY
jgi:hypothetical protein